MRNIRKIGGHIYSIQGRHTSHGKAKIQARRLRSPNTSVRVVHAPKAATTGAKKINFLVFGRFKGHATD